MNENVQYQDLKSKILTAFSGMQGSLNGEKSSAINQIRKAAAESFANTGFPTMKHENWKYTNLTFLKKHDFEIANSNEESDLSIVDIGGLIPNVVDPICITLINGKFSERLSNLTGISQGMEIIKLEESIKSMPDKIFGLFAKNAKFDQNPLEAANTALAHDGIFISVKSGEIVLNPIIILNITDSRNLSVYNSPRVIISAGKRSQSTFIEITHSIGANPSFTNSVIETQVRESAVVNYHKLTNNPDSAYCVSTNNFELSNNSALTTSSVYLSGIFQRNNLNVTLSGEHCEANLDGFYYSTGKCFIDNHTFVDHAMPNSYSNEFYKGIINGDSEAVFNGRILVRQDAQKTNAYQSNKNILLSPNASINTKPELEIYADDVKCSHGATTGSLDNESLFYMRARGIDTDTAKALLLNAFAAEIVNRIKLPALQDYILTKVTERLHPDGSYFCELL